VPDLRASVCILLNRCLLDTDDEVRDRAAYYLTILETNSQQMNNNYIMNGSFLLQFDLKMSTVTGLQVSLTGLERSLQQYCAAGAHQDTAFDLKTVAVAAQPITVLETKEKPQVAEAPIKKEEKMKASRVDMFAGVFWLTICFQ
jgi:coatomer protein complex subunit gamma